MTHFIQKSLQKFDKLTPEQARSIFAYTIEELSRVESVLDSLTVGILVCDESHKLLLSNKAASRMLLINECEYNTCQVWALVKDEIISLFIEKVLTSGDKVEGKEFEYAPFAHEDPRVLSFKVLPLVKERKVSGALIIIDDVTEKKKTEQRMLRVKNLEILTTLAAGIAHEIKNPLASMSIQIHILQKSLKTAKERYDELNIKPMYSYEELLRHLGIVNEEINRLNSIVMDFLFAVRPMYMNTRRGNVNKIIAEVLDLVGDELKEYSVEIKTELAEDIPPVDFDGRFLKQALLNLVKNAMEAMKGGGVLTIKSGASDGEVFISIADTGCGIKERDKAKIFEPYWTTKENGTGLGLVMVFKIIKEHKGEISVYSKEKKGSVFVIKLPVPREQKSLPNLRHNHNGKKA